MGGTSAPLSLGRVVLSDAGGVLVETYARTETGWRSTDTVVDATASLVRRVLIGVGAVFMSVIRHDSILGMDGVAVDVCHVGGGCDDVLGVIVRSWADH